MINFGAMSYTDEHVALCALNKIFGFHPTLALSLLEKVARPIDLFDGRHATPPDNADGTLAGLLSQLVPEQLEWGRKELEQVVSRGYRFLTMMDDDYPAPLRELPDPPIGLYLNGTSSTAEIFELRPMIAIVGTRDISPYGREWCRKLVESFAATPVQPCIVSGMAFGADGIAHRTALDCGLGTVGVMATGIEQIYPWQHAQLATDIVRSPGCALITDYPLETSPVALNFLRRNRIIAGMSRATVLVESRVKGGGMMTANLAFSYGRTVLAVPGRIDDPRSQGCNYLIKNNIAEPILGLDDLPKALGLDRGAAKKRDIRAAVKESFAGKADAALLDGLLEVAQLIRKYRGITPDELCMHTGRPYAEVAALLALLEQEDFITADLLQRCSINPKKL